MVEPTLMALESILSPAFCWVESIASFSMLIDRLYKMYIQKPTKLKPSPSVPSHIPCPVETGFNT
jgi:hypothetical protein